MTIIVEACDRLTVFAASAASLILMFSIRT